MPGLLGDALPWAYSQGDRAKRYLNGLLNDPLGTAQQAAGQFGDNTNALSRLAQEAYADPKSYQPTDPKAMNRLADLLLNGPMGFAPAGITAFRAGAPQGMTAASGGPTFYATEKKGAEPFARHGPITEYDINPQSVLDTQLAKHRALYEQFTKETGNPAGYGMSGRPYWTAEYNFKKWLDSNGHKYDAVMFDEPTGVPSYAVYGNK